MSFFQIPGNIKQSLLPFVIDPENNAINNTGVTSSTSVSGTPQLFSYRTTQNKIGCLQFFPSSITSIQIKDDISYKLLYGTSNGERAQKSITMSDILNNIPGVQIREYLPDTRLDQCINMFVDFFKNMTKLFTGDDNEQNTQGEAKPSQTKEEKEAGLFKKMTECAWFTMKYMVGGYGKSGPSFLNDMGDFGVDTRLLSGCDPDVRRYVVNFPYTMYYRLQSCVTTNIYEVPGTSSDKQVLTADGGAGWQSGSDFMSAGGFRLSGLLGKIPVVGSLANMILGNIGINYTPWWNAEAGANGAKEPQVEIKFDLFNDSADAAMVNFIFVNTIVPSNKWIQYNMFQHSTNLYDVKIEGINRLFACSGNFTVTYDGVLRTPPKAWVQELCKSHCNKAFNKEGMEKAILENNLIKIPDVYHVTLQFQSLLPANFNNFLFAYSQNNRMSVDSTYVYQQSEISQILPRALAKYQKRVAKVWKAGDENAGKTSSEKDAIAKAEEQERAKQSEENKAKERAEKNRNDELRAQIKAFEKDLG